MAINLDALKRFIETIRNIGLFDRIFGWRRIRNELIDAAGSLREAEGRLAMQEQTLNDLSGRYRVAEEKAQQSLSRKNELDVDIASMRKEGQHLQAELARLEKENVRLMRDDALRQQEHRGAVESLRTIQSQLLDERTREKEEALAQEIERLRQLKHTWSNHEVRVRHAISTISQKYAIGLVEKVPFRGNPDNTLLICEEYVVFDAKSPGSDELKNFPAYLKDQAERAHKYAKQENVRSDIFFVIPSNTLEHLSNFVFRHGDHTVYLISVDALEPVILSLKKIEEYEFAKELTPDDRENICRVLGRFAHLSKRRIQVDSFFARQFIELAYKAESDLPKDILETVMEFERSEKLNPPQEKRAKSIPLGEVEKEQEQIDREATGRGIRMEGENISESLNGLPLYKKEE
jgi:hypothetical protein